MLKPASVIGKKFWKLVVAALLLNPLKHLEVESLVLMHYFDMVG
jgi:hypothetical protein